VIGEYFL